LRGGEWEKGGDFRWRISSLSKAPRGKRGKTESQLGSTEKAPIDVLLMLLGEERIRGGKVRKEKKAGTGAQRVGDLGGESRWAGIRDLWG